MAPSGFRASFPYALRVLAQGLPLLSALESLIPHLRFPAFLFTTFDAYADLTKSYAAPMW